MQSPTIDSGNEARQKTATSFWIIYGISLVAAVVISFFIFGRPEKIYRQDAQRFSDFQREHTLLLGKADKISEQASDLVEVEKTKRLNSDAAVEEILRQRKAEFERSVAELKTDSSDGSLALLKDDIKNYLATTAALNFYMQNSHASTAEPTVLTKHDTIIRSADNKGLEQQLEQLKAAYDLVLAQNADLKRKQQGQTTTKSDGNGSSQARIADLQNQLNNCKTQAADDLKAKDVIIRNKDRDMEALKAGSGTQASDVDKAKFLFQNIDAVVRKSQSNRKGVFDALKASLEDIQRSYPDKAALNKRISDLEQLSRGVVF